MLQIEWPKITIVTPNFNGAQFLEATICSILNQGYPNLEYIIIDGGSTDQSWEIIQKYIHKLAYVVSEKDDGLYHAIQKGFDLSTGEVMGWINSDDMHHPKSLFTLGEIFGKFKDVDWLMGNPTYFDEMGRTIHCWGIQRISKYDLMIKDGGWLQQESTFWRRSLWEKCGSTLNLEYRFAGDFELWTRFSMRAQLCLTDTLLAGFRYSASGQITTVHFNDYVQETEEIRSKLLLIANDWKYHFFTFARKMIKFFNRIGILDSAKYNLWLRSFLRINNPIIHFDRYAQMFIK